VSAARKQRAAYRGCGRNRDRGSGIEFRRAIPIPLDLSPDLKRWLFPNNEIGYDQYMKRRDRSDIAKAVADAHSAAAAIRSLGLIPAGGNYATLYGLIREHELDTSHWTGRGHLRGRTHGWAKKFPLAQILVEQSSYRGGTAKLKERLCREGLLEPYCASCGLQDWKGVRLALHLDHRNGDRFDNRIENLRLLCPNCHSLTETYCGRNKGRFLSERSVAPRVSFLLATA
jgi:hypothetical protein